MSDKKGLNFHQQLKLSPLQQYYKLGRFPWRFIVHIFLVVFSTYMLLIMFNLQVSHSRSQHQTLKHILLKSDEQSNSKQLYKLSDFQDTFNNIASDILSLNDQMIRLVNLEQIYFEMIIYYKQFNTDIIGQNVIQISKEDLINGIKQPFDIKNEDSVRKFINNVNRIDLVAHNITSQEEKICYKWKIIIQYEFQQYANFVTTLDTQIYLCNKEDYINDTNYVFLDSIVIILASISFGLSFKQIYDVFMMFINQKINYEKAKQQIQHLKLRKDKQSIDLLRQQYNYLIKQRTNDEDIEDEDEEELNNIIENDKKYEEVEQVNFQKIKKIIIWIIISMIGNIILIIGCLLALIDNNSKYSFSLIRYREPIIGTGCTISWIVMLYYLSYYRGINLMASTISKAYSNIFMFFLGVMPLFCAFVFLAQCIFWKYEMFQDTQTTIMTLFSLCNGDSVNDIFLATSYDGFLSQTFIIVFMIFFFTAVQNIFIIIVMDGYESYKNEKQKNKKQKIKQNQQINSRDDFYDNFENNQLDVIKKEENDKEIVIGKLKINKKRVKLILQEMDNIYQDLQNNKNMKPTDIEYLKKVYKDNMENLNRNLKFQLDCFAK
ncbi:hypothetical protein IMG5_198190 [Ichthyophthirius multifiliis]|uniref:Polycystin cation channel PKD1/PKD2 domain-containing protein n=1 Tax=Ichthyophthirius multifiliis TaxID=5932 RepID=G0R5F3_ICHMU|nr:hypothetical protein IMG5_198190 [Ichthyophthirius multifiliis]EGR27311.1 hypothetical protein IMG5_198190 [Ichthyophthirius multifiliis]|eukprot:XP_004024195.1 hypothetical protein IMG5_198190 [Ichthyophthirius multifiliis]